MSARAGPSQAAARSSSASLVPSVRGRLRLLFRNRKFSIQNSRFKIAARAAACGAHADSDTNCGPPPPPGCGTHDLCEVGSSRTAAGCRSYRTDFAGRHFPPQPIIICHTPRSRNRGACKPNNVIRPDRATPSQRVSCRSWPPRLSPPRSGSPTAHSCS